MNSIGSRRTRTVLAADDDLETGRLKRALPIAGLTTRTTAEAIVGALRRRGGGEPDEATRQRAERNAERYLDLLGRSRGALMKAGQMLSFVSVESDVPSEYQFIYRAALARLQADAPPMSWELAESVLVAELQQSVGDIFSDFETEPLAAASIGQVHRARMRTGREVAVKIQYPGVRSAITSDVQNGELLASVISLLRTLIPGLGRMDLRAVSREIGRRIVDETDYLIEARHQARFAEAYRGHPFINVPGVVPELSTERILVQDFVTGMRWDAALDCGQDVKDLWGEAIFRFSIGGLRRLGCFNADPHPGNYLFHEDGTVSFLDFGCVVNFTPAQVNHMVELTRAVRNGDAAAARRAAVELGTFAGTAPPAEDVLAWWSDSMALITKPQPYTVTPASVAAAVRREFFPTGPSSQVVRSVNPPPELILLGRIDSGVMSVLGHLNASGYWGDILAEIDDGAPPAGRLGQSDRAFWAGR